ncbi:alginate lyase [Kwoniella mangroviensis CBS 8886]|nr:alginate lyase [Kwoniella mangroviensis CBS 8886]
MSPLTTSFLLLLSHLAITPLQISADSLQSITSSYGLTESFNFTFPDETLNSADANDWIDDKWSLYYKKGVDWGNSDIVFSPDPSTSTSTLVRRQESSTSSSTKTKTKTSSASTSSSTSITTTSVSSPASTALNGEPPVIRIEYPQGSYSKRTGGTQFYANPLTSSNAKVAAGSGNSTTTGQYERMLLSYDVWFPVGYAWNQGGKLPGLRGGPDPKGCSGGNETDGTTCFSTRLMWRSGGAAEVYAYIPTSQKNFCSQSQVTCNSDYGTSLARGSFSFVTGQWQTVQLLVVLNEVGTANGIVELWYNGVQALKFTNLVLRTSTDLNSVGGMFFSTFFGGDDSTWATPTDQFSYFRNIQLYAGAGASNLTGDKATVKSFATLNAGVCGWGMLGGIVLGLMGLWVL